MFEEMSRNNRECHESCTPMRMREEVRGQRPNDWAKEPQGHEDVIDEDDDGYFMGKYFKSIKFEMNE